MGSTFQQVASPLSSEVLQGSLEGIGDLAKLSYPPVGHCIYCSGTDNLTREHIVPFGLNRNAVLPAASCARCRQITSAFEFQVLRGPMRAVRLLRKLRSRNMHSETFVALRVHLPSFPLFSGRKTTSLVAGWAPSRIRYETTPGCFIVSRSTKIRSGDSFLPRFNYSAIRKPRATE